MLTDWRGIFIWFGKHKEMLDTLIFTVVQVVSLCVSSMCLVLIPVAARSKAWVCGRSLAGTADSNPVGGTGVCLSVLYCQV